MIGECGECGDSFTLGLCKIFFEKIEKLFCTQLVENIHHIHQSNHRTRVSGWVTFTSIHQHSPTFTTAQMEKFQAIRDGALRRKKWNSR